MINLLPDNLKQSVRREYFLRLGIVVVVMFSFAISIGLTSLLPSLFLGIIKERELAQQQTIVEKASLLRKESGIETTAGAINKKIALFESGKDEPLLPSEIIYAAARVRGEINLDGFFYQKNIDKKRVDKISITGTAVRRDALLAFADRLKGNALFEGVDVPTSNLIQSKDILFSITAFGKGGK